MYKVRQTATGAGAAGGLQVLFCTSLMLVTIMLHQIELT